MHNKTRKNCIKLIKTIEKCKKVVYYEAINKEETLIIVLNGMKNTFM